MSDHFLTEHFLLTNETARKLYHDTASGLPIIDYHSHLPPDDVANDRQFENLSRIWLEGDHYKWRAMRTLGIDEYYITGDATDEEKFHKWAFTVPYTIRNPLFHWTHLELKNYFGIRELLTPETAGDIYQKCNEMLATPDFTANALLKRNKVEAACTTDDPLDSLEYHQQVAGNQHYTRLFPTFRPDAVYATADPGAWNAYLDKLADLCSTEINSPDQLLEALKQRVDYFDRKGCMMSDHGLTTLFYREADASHINGIFDTLRGGGTIPEEDQHAIASFLLVELGKMYHEKGWAQQFHIGAFRAVNTRMTRIAGANSGFDSIADYQHGPGLAGLLDALDLNDQLPRTILYNLNPADNAMFATMAGNFNDGSIKGKVQYGPAWWFLDQKDGIENHLHIVANTGLLSCFLGMLTDSRSFLSYSRHEYFRRILCNFIGRDVENGELPADEQWLNQLITDICYRNAQEYFNL